MVTFGLLDWAFWLYWLLPSLPCYMVLSNGGSRQVLREREGEEERTRRVRKEQRKNGAGRSHRRVYAISETVPGYACYVLSVRSKQQSGEMVWLMKSAHCSFIAAELSSQHACQVAHNYLYLRLQGDPTPLVSVSDWTCVHLTPHKETHN